MRILFLLFFTCFFVSISAFSQDNTNDNQSYLDKIFLNKKNNNTYFTISNSTNFHINNKANIMIKRDTDLFQPYNDTQIQVGYHYPINNNFAIGVSGFFQNVLKFYYENENNNDLSNITIQFNGIILPGVSLRLTPIIKKINMPLFLMIVDFGFGAEITNNLDMNPDFKVKFGGFCNQFLLLPIMPANLFITDINIFALMATDTPNGWYPGVLVKNILIIKFSFFNFILKKSDSGFRIKNILSYILTGKPDIYNLESQYTYNKFYSTLYFGYLKGLELHLGYGFEYLTLARKSEWHFANKVYSELSWNKNGFSIIKEMEEVDDFGDYEKYCIVRYNY